MPFFEVIISIGLFIELPYSTDVFIAIHALCRIRPVGSGAAWRRSPHLKSAGREREKRKRREERKRKEEKERKRRKRKEKERRSRAKEVLCLYGCKTPP